MITAKTMDEIAKLSATPIMEWIKGEVERVVRERLCIPRCGGVCQNRCQEAQTALHRLTELVWLGYVGLN